MLHVITMHSKSKKWTSSDDLFGPIVSLCAKINSMAPINEMVTGSDLYQITRSSYSFDNDICQELSSYALYYLVNNNRQ
jgi:hypothetical protein